MKKQQLLDHSNGTTTTASRSTGSTDPSIGGGGHWERQQHKSVTDVCAAWISVWTGRKFGHRIAKKKFLVEGTVNGLDRLRGLKIHRPLLNFFFVRLLLRFVLFHHPLAENIFHMFRIGERRCS